MPGAFLPNNPYWCPNCRHKTGVHNLETGESQCANCGHEWTPIGKMIIFPTEATDQEVVDTMRQAAALAKLPDNPATRDGMEPGDPKLEDLGTDLLGSEVEVGSEDL